MLCDVKDVAGDIDQCEPLRREYHHCDPRMSPAMHSESSRNEKLEETRLESLNRGQENVYALFISLRTCHMNKLWTSLQQGSIKTPL